MMFPKVSLGFSTCGAQQQMGAEVVSGKWLDVSLN